MNRRQLSTLLLTLPLLRPRPAKATPARLSQPVSTPAPLPPNVVLVMADDLDAATLEANPELFANITALAQAGASFSQFFATTPLCGPSRASLLRGQYAHNTSVLVNGGEDGGFLAFHEKGREESTLATWLRDNGYRTGLFGKYLNGYPEGATPTYVPPGWDDWHAFVDELAGGEPAFYQDYQMVENGQRVTYGDDPASYSTDVLAARTVTFIADAAPAGPFFAYVTPHAPHEPAQPAARHATLLDEIALAESPSFDEIDVQDKPSYVQNSPPAAPAFLEDLADHHRDRLRSLLAIDEMVGAIVAALDEANVLDRTYVIFTSDNGSLLGEHGLWYGKEVPYEEAIRVPTYVSGPGIAPGQHVDELALILDLAPTIADWTGARLPAFVDGRSLVPLWQGDRPDHWRTAVLVENFHVRPEPRKRRRKATPTPTPTLRGSPRVPPYRALRTSSLLYVEYETDERELYDLTADPFELENLAATAPEATLGALSAHLASLETCTADTCRAAEDAPLAVSLTATPIAAPATPATP